MNSKERSSPRVDEALNEDEFRRLAAFAQFNPNPVLEFSTDGALSYFNAAAQAMANAFGKNHPSEIIPANAASIVAECLATGRSILRLETTLGLRTISWSFFPIPTSGVVHCYAGDITDRLTLESQLRNAQRMESIGKLAGGIAHDFNNILTVVQGHASMLTCAPTLTDEEIKSAQHICEAAERAANLTRQLLTFSRQQMMRSKELNLNEVVGRSVKMLQRILGEDISVRVNYAGNIPPIRADASMIEQMIMNLAVNSRDAMPKGGQITLSTSVVNIDESYVHNNPEGRVGSAMCLTVSDTGAGIEPEHLPRIFDPFFTTRDVGKGTGLGLATVYGIVKQHLGWIVVQSVVGSGTTFQIFLPALDHCTLKARADAAEEMPQKQKLPTILLVEDEPAVRELAAMILRRSGYNLHLASTGNEALAVWNQHQKVIDLLLTDMVMPDGMSGYELANRLLVEKAHLKVIYTSGYSSDVLGEDFAENANNNFLQKPYNPKRLLEMVRCCFENKS